MPECDRSKTWLHRDASRLAPARSVVVVAAVVAYGGVCSVHPAAAAQNERPNIVLIMTDDQGYGDVGVNGNDQIRTPHLDRFANEGTQLTRFYCSPVCAPTRASLMTGRNFYRTGVIHTSRGGAKMAGDEITIAEILRASGYATGIFGKWHLGDNYPMRPQDQGFAECLIHKSGGIGQTPDKPNSYFDSLLWRNGEKVKATGYCTDVFFDAALEFISENRERPFFVYLPTNAPHTPLEIADEYVEPYLRAGLDDTTARIYGMVANIDDNIGRLLKRLDESELRENTLVIFFGDNGPQQQRYVAGLRGRKSNVYEGGIRVPCFLQWPAQLEPGRTIDTIAAHVDLLPTLAAIAQAGLPSNVSHDGKSILPTLIGDQGNLADRILHFQCHRGLTPKMYQNCAVMTQQFKLVGNPGTFSDENFSVASESFWELYDIEADPGESNNLAASHPEVVKRLAADYEDWFRSVQAEREFTPGLIHLGNAAENPAVLSRYQDGNYRDGVPYGWTVQIEQSGRYRLTTNRGESTRAGKMFLDWQGQTRTQPVAENNSSAEFDIAAGTGVIDIWFQEDGRDRVIHTDNGTIGNVELLRLE